MNILFTCNEYPPEPHGGTGTFVKTIGNKMAADHNVVVYGMYKSVKQREEHKDGQLLIYKDPMPLNSMGIKDFLKARKQYAQRIKELIEKHNIDIVEVHDTNAWFLFLKTKVPVVVRLHNTERYFEKELGNKRGKLTKFFEQLSFLRKDYAVAVSDFIAQRFQNYFYLTPAKRKKLKTIYNGVNIDLFSKHTQTEIEKKIVFAGTLKPIKGVENLIEAYKLIQNKDYELHIIGPDTQSRGKSYKETLIEKTKIKDLVNKKIFFHGRMPFDQVIQMYKKSTLCVFPSLAESFGLVAIEAMACYKPVIYTREATGPEIIEDNVDGFLVDPQNNEEIAAKIDYVIENPNKMRDLCSRARDKVEANFTIDLCAQKSISLYQNLING